jgi:transcription elongation factor B subunit 1
MMASRFQEGVQQQIRFPEIASAILRVAIAYMEYRQRYEGVQEPPPFPVAPEIALEVLMAANYLDM